MYRENVFFFRFFKTLMGFQIHKKWKQELNKNPAKSTQTQNKIKIKKKTIAEMKYFQKHFTPKMTKLNGTKWK